MSIVSNSQVESSPNRLTGSLALHELVDEAEVDGVRTVLPLRRVILQSCDYYLLRALTAMQKTKNY